MEMVNHLKQTGQPIYKEGNHWALKECPFCQHKDCFKITEEMFQCFSCKEAGNRFKFESLLKGITYQEAKATLSKATILYSEDEFNARKNQTNLFNAPENLKWFLKTRKISPQVLKQFLIGCYQNKDGETIYCFPYFKEKEIPNTKFRTADKKLIFQKKDADFYVYNYNAIKNTKKLLIVEGEIDVLSTYTYKLNIPTISFGLGARNIKPEWKMLFDEVELVYISYDTDKAGTKGAKELAEFIGEDKCKIVILPKKDMNECLINDISLDEIQAALHTSLGLAQVKIFDAINAIDPNDQVLGAKLELVLKQIATRPLVEVEDYFKYIREKLPITYQQLHDFRKELKSIRKENYIKENEKEDEVALIPDDIKNEALAFLKSPDILSKLEHWLTEIGIVGESYNKVALWLFLLSRKLDKPIHTVVFGQSSSGKSELVKKVLSTIPTEDVFEFTSMTARSLDYRDDDMIAKVISISELNGSEEVAHTLRVAQSEQRLNRAYTVKDEITGNMRNVEKSIEIRSSFVITTTEASLHNENSTRIFSLYADESIVQTKRISDFIKYSHTREYKTNSHHCQRATEILKAVQSFIQPIEVVIPFASLLDFPSETTRNRRDLTRFLAFITVITLLNQHKKQVKRDSHGEYIESDIEDYAMTYKYLLPIIKNTLSDLSPRDELVLKVCCLVQDSLKDIHSERLFTVKDIQSMANKNEIDLKNSVNLRNELFELCEKDFLELSGGQFGKKGSRQKFRVIASYKINDDGSLEIENKESALLTPDELKNKITTLKSQSNTI